MTALGKNLATGTAQAGTSPLPTTLAGTTVIVKDALGTSRPAPLFYVSPGQVNYLVPADTALGTGSITITAANGATSSVAAQFVPVAPGLFTLNAANLLAGSILRVVGSGQKAEDLYQVDGSGAVVPRPVDAGSQAEPAYLIAYGTGIRGLGSIVNVSATIGGEKAIVYYAGKQGSFQGLDQVNILIPYNLAGRGDVPVEISVNGQPANVVHITIK